MGIYLDGEPLDVANHLGDLDNVFLGSDEVWPGVRLPYVVENVNISDAIVPVDATGCWVTLFGGGQGGGKGDDSTRGNSGTNGNGGGGGAGIGRSWVPRENLGETWSLIVGQGGGSPLVNGTASVFASGPVTLTAGGGKTGGGTATVVGVSGILSQNGGAATQSVTGAGAGGGKESSGGTGTARDALSPKPGNGGNGGADSASWEQGSDNRYTAGGGGGGGGGWTNGGDGAKGARNNGGAGGAGGDGYARVEWVRSPPGRDVTYVFNNAGNWSFQLPVWAVDGALVDVVIIGGGAGGRNQLYSSNNGGKASAFVYASSLEVGVGFAPDTVLTGAVGAGGDSGNGNGGTTTCTQLGLTSHGGSGVVNGQAGEQPTPLTLNGAVYSNGGAGGDGSAALFVSGKPGQSGCVYVRVRQ